MGLAIADIKRFVNDGLTPINALIGAPSDAANKNGSLHAKSAYLVSKVDDMSTKINNISAGISNIGGEKHYEPDDNNTIFSWSAEYNSNTLQGSFPYHAFFSNIFYPKYDGVLKCYFQTSLPQSSTNEQTFLLFNSWEVYSSAKVQSGTGSSMLVSDVTMKFPFLTLLQSSAANNFFMSGNDLYYGNESAENDPLFKGYAAFDVNGFRPRNTAGVVWETRKPFFCKKGWPIRLMYAPYVFTSPISLLLRFTGREVA